MDSPGLAPSDDPAQDELTQALQGVLLPLARLAVAKGVGVPSLEELLKVAMVEAAREAHPGLDPNRSVSRIATTLSLNRREVTRLTRPDTDRGRRRRAPASVLFTRWRTDPALRGEDGTPRPLPRLGPAPSFESLAHSITQDVHPRSLLDELCRLNLARLDEASDVVTLQNESFVPRGDVSRMLSFLGDNLGDHAAASVANVLGSGREHFDQAVFANGLSLESMKQFREAVTEQWRQLLASMVPLLERLIAEDDAAGRRTDQRVRVGLYTYQHQEGGPALPVEATAPVPPRRRRSTKP